MKESKKVLSSFYSQADLLGEKLAGILFQMPPSLTKEKHMKTLEDFLRILSPDGDVLNCLEKIVVEKRSGMRYPLGK